MGAGFDVLDAIFFKLLFKPRGAAPIGVLAAVIGKHLFGHTVLADGPSVGLDDVLGRLAAV